jgi:hypothetical protein
MGAERDIDEAVKKLAGTQFRDDMTVVQATVVSYDIPSRSCYCTPISGQAVTDLPNVQLMAEVDDGIMIVPTVGSTVFVLYSTHHAPFIALFSEVDQIVLISGGAQIKISNTGLVQFNDGTYGGLIQIAQLLTKINNLENLVNDLITKYNAHTHAGVEAGAGITAPPTPTEDESLTPTERDELENTTVTHGQLLE